MIKIWCSYHNDNLIQEYKLDELSNDYELFNTNNLHISNENINHLNKYLNEYCTLYYVWKNNIKSDIIGFCHYRRKFNVIDFNRINNNEIQAYEIYETPAYNMFEDINYLGLGLYFDTILNYIKENYIEYYFDTINLFFDSNVCNRKKLIRESFICNWNIFNDLMIFVNNFLKLQIFKKDITDLSINDIDNISLLLNEYQWNLREEFLSYKKHSNYTGDFLGYHRNIAFLIEYLIVLYFLIFHKNNYFTE